MKLHLIHTGLPDEAPWLFRVPLRSRAFLVITVVVTVIVSTIAATSPEWLLRVDQPIADWVRGLGGGGDHSLAALITHLGSPAIAVVVGVVAALILWNQCRAAALTLLALITAAQLADVVLKLIVDRARPSDPLVSTTLGSFPSGHVIHAVVVFGLVPFLLWVLTQRRGLMRFGFALFGIVVVLVAISRVRLGAHWPSDVISSVLIGMSLLLGAERLLTSVWAAERCAFPGATPH